MTPDPGPRARLLDAALTLIGSQGMRGLTHRRLEEAAGLARGSARYHLGSTDQIVAGALEHAAVRETQAVDAALARLGLDALAGVPASLPTMAAALVDALLSDPVAVRARYELLIEASRQPSLADEARRWRAHFVATADQALAAAGIADPGPVATQIVAVLDGLTFDGLITGRDDAAELARGAVAAVISAAVRSERQSAEDGVDDDE